MTVVNNQGETSIPYARIIRLTTDNAYDYLFLNSYGAYMLAREEGKKEEAFRTFLSQKTGLEWLPVKSAFMISVKQLVRERKNTRRA